MKDILLLGPGTNRNRLGLNGLFGLPFGEANDERLDVMDRNTDVLRFWRQYGAGEYKVDLLRVPGLWPKQYDEIHAYEVLNLLPGTADEFFDLWKWFWFILKPNGKVFATVPHWASRFVYAYPALQRTYTPELLGYLDHNHKMYAKEDFPQWSEPYNFATIGKWEIANEMQQPVGFRFVVEKNKWQKS